MKERDEVYFNKIFIIQSLSSNERPTGREIESKIKYLSYKDLPINVQLIDVHTSDELIGALIEINAVIPKGILPFIHFEIHGSKQGFILSNNELVEWNKIKDTLLTINKSTKNNLFISLATCYGGYLLNIYKPWEPCPFYGYIGPTEEVYNRDLEASYSVFFEILLTLNDFAKAIEMLQMTVDGNSGKYAFLNCYGYFDRLMKLYKEENENPKVISRRTNDIIKKYKERNPQGILTNKELRREVAKLLFNKAEDHEFEKMRKIFFHEL